MRRKDATCPHCTTKIGEFVAVGDEWLLAVGFQDDTVHGLCIRVLSDAVCLACGGEYSYSWEPHYEAKVGSEPRVVL